MPTQIGLRDRLTYANVVATLALVLALGGTAYAAIKPPRNSVGTRQLKARAVTRGKLANNAVNGAKVENGSLSGADINVLALGTIPAATNADHATAATSATRVDSVMSSGLVMASVDKRKALLTAWPFTIVGECIANGFGNIKAKSAITTDMNGAAVESSSGYGQPFNISSGELELASATATPPDRDFNGANDSPFSAVAPDGTAIHGLISEGVNDFGADCFFDVNVFKG